MKKVLLFAIAIVSIGFTSCKKDYKCVCTENGEVFMEADIKDSRRPEASTACNAFELGSSADCKLQ